MARKKDAAGRNSHQTRRMEKCTPMKQVAVDEPRPWDGQTKSARRSRGIGLTVATRQQSTREQRHFEAALELLLTEIVRQEIAGDETDTK